MSGSWDRPVERAVRLLAGLVIFGLAMALLVQADLGVDPWTVFAQGVAKHTGLSLGTVIVLSSVLVLAAWIPLHQRPGLGTVLNALLVGPVVDIGVALIPAPERLVWQAAFLVLAIGGAAVATGLYIGAGWGPGPRDGLMTGFAALGVPISVSRTAIELTVLAIGWVLGGTVGIGTVLFAGSIGPLVARTLPALSVRPLLGRPGTPYGPRSSRASRRSARRGTPRGRSSR